MLLKRLTFNDYRLFKSRKVIDVSVDYSTDRNIILIGAQNGSGKTSILDGIKLALYGSDAALTEGESYEQFIKDSINKKSFREGKRKFSIELEFEKELMGLSTTTIKREWLLNNDGSLKQENLNIYENNQIKTELEDEQDKFDYIEALVPAGVSQFFFFDGEKIQYMADDDGHESVLIDAIKDILNINIYSKLEDDLESYERIQKKEQIEAKDSDLLLAEAELKKAEEELEEHKASITEKIKKLNSLSGKIESLKSWLKRQGLSTSEKRVEIQDKIEFLEGEKEDLQNELSRYVNDTLPYLILGSNIKELYDKILEEREYKKTLFNADQIKGNAEQLINVLDDKDIIPSLTREQRYIISKKIMAKWNELIGIGQIDDIKLLHDLTNNEIESLLALISDIVQGDYSDIEKIVKRYDEVLYDINKLRQLLKKIPSDDLVIQKENELDLCQLEKGKLIKEIDDDELIQHKLKETITTAKKRLDHLLDKVALSKKVSQKVEKSKKIRGALHEFVHELTVEKAQDVQYHLTEMFNRLARKKDLVSAFRINPQTFEVTFENYNGETLPKRRLSAGEKAIYAISLVWALAQASQRPLPIVIDTPLGRMDKDHRRNMLNHYFPNANRQVLILSTDEEIADEWKEMINCYISKEYLLIAEGEETTVYRGYFGGDLVEL